MGFRLDAPVPSVGRPVRLELLGVQWLFERRAEGVACVAVEESLAYEGLLGLPEDGLLRIEPVLPRHALEVRITSNLVLAPGSRVKGWLALPVEQRISFVDGDGAQQLLVLEESRLRTGWRDGSGYYHPWTSGFHLQPRKDLGRRAWVRTFIRNRAADVIEADLCRLALGDLDVEVLRGLAIGPGVHWSFGIGGGVRVRPVPRFSGSPVLRAGFPRFGEVAS